MDAVIVTGDRDSYQLAGEHTSILYTKRGITDTERVTPAWIQEKYGVTPVQMIDIKSLMGDASDNIPGVPGVGEKTAMKLIAEYGSLESVLENAETKLKGAMQKRILENVEQAKESKFLATIARRAPLAFDFEECRLGDFSGALELMRKLRLKSLIDRMGSLQKAAPAKEEAKPAAQKQKITSVQGAQMLSETMKEWMNDAPKMAAVSLLENLSIALDDGRRLVCERGGDLLSAGLSDEEITQALMPLFENGNVRVVMHNMKAFPGEIDALTDRAEDTLLMAYALNPQKSAAGLADACAFENIAFDADCPASSVMELYETLSAALERDNLTSLYRDMEIPLMFVLKGMEKAGFRVDENYLKTLGDMYVERIGDITKKISEEAGEAGRNINLNSPKQLAKLLFEDMHIPSPTGKKGNPGTSAEVLEELAEKYPICADILEYRKYQKLNSTYVTGLTRQQSADGRIHTSFEQAVTGTGRISSREPNLQNIPVRTELGREIRRAFVAEDGWTLVDADYSQIELRVLAHMAGDKGMQDAFIKDEDIHARTAAEVFGVPLDEVTREMRSAAKAVNFGIVYGISDFGLAKNIGVSRHEAADFIERYFARYPNVKKYMDEQVALGKAQGYVSTMLGRRRYLPELNNPSYNMRAFGERAAMNSPIQGTAADIIKLAMVKVAKSLQENHLRARLIMQVHDELIVETPLEEKETVEKLLRSGMESVMNLSVPLKAEVSTGGNWNECKS